MTVLTQKRKFSYFWFALIVLPIVSALVTAIILLVSPSKAQGQIEETPTVIDTPTPTPTPVPRILQFNGTSVLNGTQPILSSEYIDAENNRGYADASEVRIREIGIQAETNFLIWRVRLKDSGKIIEERYATDREARAYEQYREQTATNSEKSSELSDLRFKAQEFSRLSAAQKDELLKQLLDKIIEYEEN